MNRSWTRVRRWQQAFKRSIRQLATFFKRLRQHEGEYNNPELLIYAWAA
jgi:hypothetical protein